ncbi:solute carrier family 2, facilitated glucose transporter member 5-like [Gracilinanus agilis]|uniref:solute carrier family 2, facilitated glucose transporter member 5-like n=1 Tax=Gracilinanus agilis TaxID=191870 RepID=UPI001CFD76AC|nr:solute carrier family 2, facilitated glucose transporter member 5-like [Gracilinanus agilis]
MKFNPLILQTLSVPQRLTLVLGLVMLVVAFGSSFQYGYNVAVINSPAEIMKNFYNQTYYNKTSEYLNNTFLTLLWSLTVSMFPLGGLIGSLMVASMINKCGRKGALMISNIFSIVPATLIGYSKMLNSFVIIIFARILVGICAGMTYKVVPLYLEELVPKNLRGAVSFVNQLFITIGIFVAQIFGFRCILATEEEWPILFGLTGILEVIELILLPFFPESPRYTLIQRGDEEGARIEAELLDMAVISVFIVERLGRRLLLLIGFSVCCLACIVLTVALSLQDTMAEMPYVSITSVMVYVIGHAIGPSPVPSVVRTEIFLQSSRPAAFMVDGAVHWLTNFIIGLVFPFIQEGIGAYSFIIFAAICLFTAIYIYVIIPETKGQTFVEISQVFAKRNKVEILEKKKEETTDFNSCPHLPSKKETNF